VIKYVIPGGTIIVMGKKGFGLSRVIGETDILEHASSTIRRPEIVTGVRAMRIASY